MAGAGVGREPRLSQGRGLGGAHGATGGGCRAGALGGGGESFLLKLQIFGTSRMIIFD